MGKQQNIENKITKHLQQDVVKISGKTIFINPFLYWRRFDENTIGGFENLVKCQKNKFKLIEIVYPEIDWSDLNDDQSFKTQL